MNRIVALPGMVICLALVASQVVAAEKAPARKVDAPRITIDPAQARAPMSKYIYGQFIEHLGRCIYGGIWAEMLEDRKFFEAVGAKTSPWKAVGPAANLTMDRQQPFVGSHSPKISLSGQPAGIVQGELALRKGKQYVGRVWLAGSEKAGRATVSLVWGDAPGDRQTIETAPLSKEFAKTELKFSPPADTDHGRLEITAAGEGDFRVGTASLMPADNVQGMRADTLELLKQLNSPVYRWPGGNFVSGYNWHDGIGDRDRRPPRKNPAWQGIEHNDFGLDEFLVFCRLLKTDPYIAVNSGLGDVQLAADEVEYANGAADTPMGKLRAANGHAEPYGVRWWSVGNEMYGGWQLGHMSLEKYVQKHNVFAQAMRKIDPSIQLIGVGDAGPWSENMLKYCADAMNLISEHFYCGEKPDVAAHVRQISDAIRHKATAHRGYRQKIDSLVGKDIRIAMDEWNYWYGKHEYGELGTRYFLRDALGIAAGIHEFARQSDIVFMANYAQTVNVIGAIKTTKTDAAFETTGLVLKLYRQHFGSIPVATEVSGPLDAQAAWTTDRQALTIGVVNPTDAKLEVPLELRGYSLVGDGTVSTITGPGPMAFNAPGKESQVKIVETSLKGLVDRLEVGPYSISLFRLPVKAEPPKTAAITVNLDKPGAKISPTLYGIFFEDINLSADGGIYPELVRNRSFEDAGTPDHWTIEGDATKVKMAIDTERPTGQQNRRALRLSILPGGEKTALVNPGYWGMALVKGDQYDLTLTARAAGDNPGPMILRLESGDGQQTYAEGRVEDLGADWKTVRLTLKADATDAKARLAIRLARPGTVWLDYVSLLPKKTWKNHGLRPDLAEMLARMKPAFVRFPGGCWVEGDTMRDAYRWKLTIGEPAQRRTAPNLWQYQATNGLGYHEYLQMCEDLGAEPLFVINCGMSHRENVPMDKMGEYVQDALDAIEYANGPVESKWGAVRAKAGHPKPFNLKYMEIGNENGGKPYQERFPLFVDAIKAKHPEIQLVANEWGGVPKGRPIEIVDEHYYSTPEFFMENANRYDNYDRKGPKIYVGEYAVTQNCGQGNLAGALGEAAFMTGMERNGDIVAFSSYAPLFVNVHYKRWNPDLINFDSSRVFGLPSYYVQEMFAANRGDVVLPLELECSADSSSLTYPGGIGLGTWNTQAEYKDVRVTQGDKTLLAADFAKGTEGWRVHSGQWKTQDGALRQSEMKDDLWVTTGDPNWSDYTYSLKARKLAGAEGFLIMFQVRDGSHWVWWNLGGWGNSKHALEQCSGGKTMLGPGVPGKIETGRWYDIRVEVKGPQIRCFLDGKLIHDVRRGVTQPLYAVASRIEATSETVLKVVNVSDSDRDTQLDLKGAAAIGSKAAATVLTADQRTAENSLDEPTKVAPKTFSIENAGKSFRFTFPARSVTVLRLSGKA